jgi:hypothetical protein
MSSPINHADLSWYQLSATIYFSMIDVACEEGQEGVLNQEI